MVARCWIWGVIGQSSIDLGEMVDHRCTPYCALLPTAPKSTMYLVVKTWYSDRDRDWGTRIMRRLRRNRARAWLRRVATYMLAAGRFVLAGRRRADRRAGALQAQSPRRGQEKEGYECKVCGVFCEPSDLESFYQHMRGRRHMRKLRLIRARARLRSVVTCMLAAGRFVVAGRRRAARRAGDENFWAHWDRLTVLNMKVALVRRELARNRRRAATRAATVMLNKTLRVARARVIATKRRRAAKRRKRMRLAATFSLAVGCFVVAGRRREATRRKEAALQRARNRLRRAAAFSLAVGCFIVAGRRRGYRRRKQLYQKSLETRCVVCLCAEKTHAVVPCGHKCLCRSCAEKQKLTRCPLCRKFIMLIVQIYD